MSITRRNVFENNDEEKIVTKQLPVLWPRLNSKLGSQNFPLKYSLQLYILLKNVFERGIQCVGI